jgi:hypothetical protein
MWRLPHRLFLQVLPLLVVDNSNFFPTRLTFPHDAPYSSFSEGDCPFSSFQTKRILHEPTYVLVLPPVLSRAALCPVLAPSWSGPVESRCQDTHEAPPSAQTPLSTRLPCLSSRLHCFIGWRASATACASLARGQKPARSTQADRHRRLRLSQSAVRLLRDHRCAHPCPRRGWQAWPCRADPDLSRSCLPQHVHCPAPHSLLPSENPLASDHRRALCAGRRAGSFGCRTGL